MAHVYYKQFNEATITMLGGGDKSSQGVDIEAAKVLADTIEE